MLTKTVDTIRINVVWFTLIMLSETYLYKLKKLVLNFIKNHLLVIQPPLIGFSAGLNFIFLYDILLF
jgi:hypothetical protein